MIHFKNQKKEYTLLSAQTSSFVRGFTLVEVLVSVTLFTVVAVTGITAVITAKGAYEKSKSIRATTDSLSFILEDISRTARLGDLFHCINLPGVPSVNLEVIEEPLDSEPGQSCDGVSYEPFWDATPGDPEDQIIYVFGQLADGTGALFARNVFDTASGGTIDIDEQHFQRITPTNLNIDLDRSGFDVVGAEGFEQQPRIIMRIHGTITNKNQETHVSMQTTISQRAIRVEP